jgi:tetratricopeptide (TPR) repeat protein
MNQPFARAALHAARCVFLATLLALGEAPAPAAAAEAAATASAKPSAAKPGAPPTAAEIDREIALLRSELERAGSDALQARIRERLAQLWILRAREYVGVHDANRAADAYEKALDLFPDLLPAVAELGFLELRAGDSDRALLLADQGLLAHPEDGWLRELRGEALYRDGRLAEALPEYEAALAARPGDAGLAKRLEKLRRELAAEGSYDRSLTAHFTLSFDGTRDEAAGRLVLDVLEEANGKLSSELSVYAAQPIPVVLYTKEQFHDTTATGSEVAGLFDGKIRLPVGGVTESSPGLVRVVRHELVHALVAAKGPGDVPRWLHEGLAQLLEPLDSARAVSAVLAAWKSAGTAGIDPFSYPTALSFTAYLDENHGRARLIWLVELMAGGRAEDAAFDEAFGASRDELVTAWVRSLGGNR